MLMDLIVVVLLGGFVLFGLWFGFVHTLGALAGTVLGAFLAGAFYDPVASFLSGRLGWDLNLMRVVSFLVLFVLINRLIGLGFYVVEKVFRFISILPFVRTIDHILGMILGFFEGVLVIGLTLIVAERFPFGSLVSMIASSAVAAWLMKTASILLPLLPAALKAAV